MIHYKKLLFFIAFALLQALPAKAQWAEKYPITVPITPANSISIWLRANFGKIGDIAAKRVDDILNDPVKQAKLSAKAINYLYALYADSTKTEDEKAKAFISEIQADIASYVSTPSGSMNVIIGYSANFDVIRLNWDRQKSRNYCQKQTCTCPDGSRSPGAGYSCYTNQSLAVNSFQQIQYQVANTAPTQ
jgi:hypothetical protein